MTSQISTTTIHDGITYTAELLDDNAAGIVMIASDEHVAREWVGTGRWDGARIECDAVLGHDQDAADEIYDALEGGLAAALTAARLADVATIDPRYTTSTDPRAVYRAWGGKDDQSLTMDMGGWTSDDALDVFAACVQAESLHMAGEALGLVRIERIARDGECG